jgi:hypothetical protein
LGEKLVVEKSMKIKYARGAKEKVTCNVRKVGVWRLKGVMGDTEIGI